MFLFSRRLIVRKIFSLSLITSLLSVNVLTAYSWSASPDLAPKITEVTLPSGQQVYVQEIHTQPIITIDTWVNTGSAQETPQNNGVSHFLEHLLFKGTTHYKLGVIDRTLESKGDNFNAATSDDFTHFHITTATPYFQEALNMHADMLLNATINPPELNRERKVVQEEINRSLDNPARIATMALSKAMFNHHPYAMDTLGPKSNIQNIPRQDILGYYHRWYQPRNFKTIIVGDISTPKAIALVNAAFKKAYVSQARPSIGKPKIYPVAPIPSPKSVVLTDPNLSDEQLQLGFPAPSVAHREDNFALDVAALILGQGISSRLYQDLKEQNQWVNDISAGNSTRQQAGIFYIAADLKPENRDAAKKAIVDEINRFKTEGPTSIELEKAKTQVVKSFAFSTESTEGVAETIGYNVTIGKLTDYTDYVKNIQKITAADVRRAVDEYLNFSHAVLVESLPASFQAEKDQETKNNIALLDEASKVAITDLAPSKASLAGSTSPSSLHQGTHTTTHHPEPTQTKVMKITLKDGATLLLKPSPTTQTIAISIFAKGGRLVQPQPGVASLASRSLLKGTKNHTAKQLGEALERFGLSVSADSTSDYFQINAASVNTDIDKLLAILGDIMDNPTFPKEEVDKERADLLEEIKTSRDEPSNMMFEDLTKALYPHHPYGDVGSRVEKSLPAVSREEVVNYYQSQIQPQNLTVSVVGNFNPMTVKTRLAEIFDQLPKPPKGTELVKSYPSVSPLSKTVEIEAHKPEQAATWIAYGWHAPAISTSKDYITLKVINTLLGAGLSSRLFTDLREKQGLAYHVSTMYPSNLETGNFIMYIGTDPKNQAKVLTGFNHEIQRLKEEPVSQAELDRVKSKLIGSFELAHESNANQAYYLGIYQTLGVGYLFDKEYPHLVSQITSQDVQRVARHYFDQPKVITIVDPKTVRTDEALNPN